MSVYVLQGYESNVTTRVLPSHDIVISKPSHSILELAVFDVVKACSGVFRAEYGGWIVPAKNVSRAYSMLDRKFKKIS
jgi:hypothetical protein